MAISKGFDIDFILRNVSEFFGVEPKYIESNCKERKASLARSIVCFLAVDKLRISGREVARRLGIIPSTVSKALARARSNKYSELIWKQIMESEG